MMSNQITASVSGVRSRSNSTTEARDVKIPTNMKPRSNSTIEAKDIKNRVIAPLVQHPDPASPGTGSSKYFHADQSQLPQSSLSPSPLSDQIKAQPTNPPVPPAPTPPRPLTPILEKKPSFIRRTLNTIKENPKTFFALIFPITTIPTLIFIGIRYFYNNSKALTVEIKTTQVRASLSSSIREYQYSLSSHSSAENDVDDVLIPDDNNKIDPDSGILHP